MHRELHSLEFECGVLASMAYRGLSSLWQSDGQCHCKDECVGKLLQTVWEWRIRVGLTDVKPANGDSGMDRCPIASDRVVLGERESRRPAFDWELQQ